MLFVLDLTSGVSATVAVSALFAAARKKCRFPSCGWYSLLSSLQLSIFSPPKCVWKTNPEQTNTVLHHLSCFFGPPISCVCAIISRDQWHPCSFRSWSRQPLLFGYCAAPHLSFISFLSVWVCVYRVFVARLQFTSLREAGLERGQAFRPAYYAPIWLWLPNKCWEKEEKLANMQGNRAPFEMQNPTKAEANTWYG